ncbi:MAG: S8 family peptidase [Ignavibacteriales bacterium]|nr:S8 family peptidase [Ignavibacteriales bacterium]
MKTRILLICVLLSYVLYPQNTAVKFSEILSSRFAKSQSGEQIAAWVFFTDKGQQNAMWKSNPEMYLTRRSIERRALRGLTGTIVDETDFPVSANYMAAVEQTGVSVRQRSKWFNGLSINASKEQLLAIAALPFVKNLDIVYQLKKEKPLAPSTETVPYIEQPKNVYAYDYGQSLTQLQQINVPNVHNLGITGEGVIVCVMDAGFSLLAHQAFSTMQIIATYDFVNHRIGVGDSTGLMGEGSHGTQTLSTIGGFKAGQLIGPAFKAKYILAKTENTDSETPIEEDNWIAAAEFADSLGVDVTSTSLGYITFDAPYTSYTWQSMDGETCRITIAADMAVNKGIVVVNSAGNEGSNTSHNTLGAPADGKRVIAVGAVTSSGTRSYFSSVGNSVDGRVKPDVMAMGSSVRVASPYSSTGYTNSDGTSFSGPLAGGVAALVVCARPYLNPIQVRDAMRNTASRANNPGREYGWGILNALNAINYFPAIAPPVLLWPSNNNIIPTAGNKLVWYKASNATSYKVQLSTNSAFTDLVINDSTITDTTRLLPVLAPNTTYYWRVASKTASASSQFSSAGIFKTKATQITWQDILRTRNAINESQVLVWGTSSLASDGIDSALDEITLPPLPPTGIFTSFFELPLPEYEASFRDFRNDTNRTATWSVRMQSGDGGYPIVLTWNPAALPAGKFTLKDPITGTIVNVNMKTQSSYSLTQTALTTLKIVYEKNACNEVSVSNGWNIVSAPVVAADMGASVLFPTANSPAYGFDNGYSNAETLVPGKGYWIRFPQSAVSSICGAPFGNSVSLNQGWNLFGVNDKDVTLSQITTVPAGILSSQIYGYSNGYNNPTTLATGKGFWVRTSQAGTLYFNQSSTAKSNDAVAFTPDKSYTSIIVTDNAGSRRILYLGENYLLPNSNLVSLPPVPPAGIFDARFSDNTMAAASSTEQVLLLQGAVYPVAITVEGKTLTLTDLATGGKLLQANSRQQNVITVNNANISAIGITAENTPDEFVLYKNYPNPFNPSTTISFRLAANEKVKLTVYDILGNTVAVLANGMMEAGMHKVEFNAAGLASGLYIYEIHAGSKTLQNKMLLLK